MDIATKPVKVTSRVDGDKEPAQLAYCPDCGCSMFFIYWLERNSHMHLQCSQCSEAYCDGGCQDGKR